MPDDDSAEVGGHRRQFALATASAVSVVLVATAAVGVHSWLDTAAHGPAAGGLSANGPAADGPAPVTPSASPLASTISSPPVASASDPVFSSAPTFSSAPIASLAPVTSPPSPSSSPTTRHASPKAPAVKDESHLNFQVSMRLSPTHVMLGQQTRVTVTVLNAGHGVDPPADLSIGSMVPSDDFGDAPSSCTIGNGGVDCPIAALLAGREKTITFTVTAGYYPGDTWDDQIYGQLNYADSFGQQQQLQPSYSADLFVDAVALSTPPTSAAPISAAPSPSAIG